MAGIFVPGCILQYASALHEATGITWTTVTNLESVGLPVGSDVDKLDTTTHEVIDEAYTRNFEPGLVTRVDIPFSLNFDVREASHRYLANASNVRTKVGWRIYLPWIDASGLAVPDAPTIGGTLQTQKANWVFNGWATMTPPDAGMTDILKASGTIIVATAVTFQNQS